MKVIVAGSSFLWVFNLLAIFFCEIHGSNEIHASQHDKVVACYVEGWAAYRPERGQFTIEDIRPEYCTHLIYAFAGLDATAWKIKSLDPKLDLDNSGKTGTYKKITGLRRRYPHLKISLAIGGWNEGSLNYSTMVASPSRRQTFIASVVDFLSQHDFDGLDLDWEYPARREGLPQDKENFVLLVKELKDAFAGKNLLLTAAIGAPTGLMDQSYDIPEISKYLDYIYIMSYDYHGLWDKKVNSHAPLKSDDGLSVEASVEHLLNKGAPSNKLVLGLPFYGRSFTLTSALKNSEESPFGTPIENNAKAGPYTKEPGFFAYNEICKNLLEKPKEWRTGWDDKLSTAYAINGNDVIVYDNDKSITRKIEYLKKMNLAGVMIWALDHDDFRGDCAAVHKSMFLNTAYTELSYPCMKIINMALGNSKHNDENNDTPNDIKVINDVPNNNVNNMMDNKIDKSMNQESVHDNHNSNSVGSPYSSPMIFLLKISAIFFLLF